MPSKSKKQQNLMRLALAYKRGHLKKSEVTQEVIQIADSMTVKQLRDYANNLVAESNHDLYDFDTHEFIQQLIMGIEVESEHTDDLIQRARIALDHLEEDKQYYTKLKEAGL